MSDSSEQPPEQGAEATHAIEKVSSASALALQEKPQERLKLKGSLKLADGQTASAELWLCANGLWLVDAATPQPSIQIAVLEQRPLSYLSKMLGDRLVIGAETFAIPTGSGGQAKRMLALARLRKTQTSSESSEDGAANTPLAPPFLDSRNVLQRAWLQHWLAEDEQLLAWLDTADEESLPSAVGEVEKAPITWLLTDRRSALVAIGPYGDTLVKVLRQVALEVADGMARCAVEAADQRWQSTLTNAGDYRLLAAAAGADRTLRRRDVARAAWHSRRGKGDRAHWARTILRANADEADALATLTLNALSEPAKFTDETLEAIAAIDNSHDSLAGWSERWELAEPVRVQLIDALREAQHHHHAAALHEHCWRAAIDKEKQPLARARLCDRLADDLVAAGQQERAAELLEQALAALPSPDVLELIPHVDSAEAGGPLQLRLQLLDKMVEVSGEPHKPHLPSLLAVAQLFPLSPERVEALANAAEGDLKKRAEALLSCLRPQGLCPIADSAPNESAGTLSTTEIEQLLRHPAAREDGALGRLQSILAEVEVPDQSALRSYCQRLESNVAPAAHAALERSIAALACRPIGAYVSRGGKSVGMRAFEGPEPFLLVGGDHLDEKSPFFLGPHEMAFCIACEVAHVRFGHARVTSSDLWRGALEKGKSTLEVALSLMPALKAFKLGGRIATLAGHVQDAPVGTVLNAASRWWPKNKDEPLDPSVSSGHEQLLAAHRVTQFTADRVGLLVAANLAASLRALFLTWSGYQQELAMVQADGLGALLDQRTKEGTLRFGELAARIGALAAFYLSDDFVKLRQALNDRTATPVLPEAAATPALPEAAAEA